jgi:hypothetical protein
MGPSIKYIGRGSENFAKCVYAYAFGMYTAIIFEGRGTKILTRVYVLYPIVEFYGSEFQIRQFTKFPCCIYS